MAIFGMALTAFRLTLTLSPALTRITAGVNLMLSDPVRVKVFTAPAGAALGAAAFGAALVAWASASVGDSVSAAAHSTAPSTARRE